MTTPTGFGWVLFFFAATLWSFVSKLYQNSQYQCSLAHIFRHSDRNHFFSVISKTFRSVTEEKPGWVLTVVGNKGLILVARHAAGYAVWPHRHAHTRSTNPLLIPGISATSLREGIAGESHVNVI